MGLLNVITIEEVKQLLEEHFGDYHLGIEPVAVEDAAGRYLAVDLCSDVTVPAFRRSTMDGYAVRSVDVSGASETLPAFLSLKGEVHMGKAAGFALKAGESAYVPTGGMIPDGADAVVMVEYSEKLTDDEISLFRPAAVKENVISIGDDINEGAVVLKRGRRLTSADLGVLTSLGCSEAEVFKKPTVSVLSTGDEIAAPDEEIELGRIRDINTYTISSAAQQLGCNVIFRKVVRDDKTLLAESLKKCHEKSDIVLLSGGSSAGVKDYSLQVMTSLGEPGILCHGIAFKPGKPTIISNSGGKPVIGLPGHPVSALIVFNIIGEYLIRLMNRTPQRIETWVDAVLLENVNGAPGREAWQMVELIRNGSDYEARPVHGESGLITMLAAASGSIRIPRNTEGFSKGSIVKVYPFER